MAMQSTFSSLVSPTPIAFPPDEISDSKSRAEYERGRQRALKSHDARKKYNGRDKTSAVITTAAGGSMLKRSSGLGHGSSWRNTVITQEDMEVVLSDNEYDLDDEDADKVDKENSRPSSRASSSVSLEDLIRPALNKKPRKSVNRTSLSLSRQASADSLNSNFPALVLTSPSPALPCPLPSISESSSDEDISFLLFNPMQSFDFSNNDFYNDNSTTDDDVLGLPPPGADDWTMDETEDGCLRFVNLSVSAANSASCATAGEAAIILVEGCVW